MLRKKIIGCFYRVYNELGYGFLEKVYEKAMMIELASEGLKAINQYPINVVYHNIIIGEYKADLMIEDKVIVEIKAASEFHERFEAQLLNYLKATDIEVGLLINFGPTPKFYRKAYDNMNK
ncbi:GxxExxY protein [Lewinellaceae bacterium SD302]|nr:GxxExxY protein [Lewinellaceae bacterium SD302]